MTLRNAIEDAAAAGICSSGGRNEYTEYASYLIHIQLTAAERAVLNLGIVMWGRPEIERRMFCHMYGIKLHLIEKFNARGQNLISHQLVDSSGSKSVDENASCYNDPQTIHSLNEGLCHSVPILHKTSAANKPNYIYIIYVSQINLLELSRTDYEIGQCNTIQYKNLIAQYSLIIIHQLRAV